MKKLGLVVGSLVLATIGGVYANWVYLSNTDIEYNHRVAAFGMTDKTSSAAEVGAYEVTDNIATFEIDQASTDPVDYTAVLQRYYDSGTAPEITVTFTTKVGASSDIETNGIETYVYFGFSTMPTYDDPTTDAVETDEIFDVKYDKANYITIYRADYTGTVDQDRSYKWEMVGGVLTVELQLDAEELITMNTFVLDSIEKNEAFEDALSEFNIWVTSKNPATV